MPVDAVVLAGGLGTRLRAAVPDAPKPMAPVGGRPFLEWLLDHWIAQGIRRFVLSVGHQAERITGHFGRVWHGAQIVCSTEAAPLGTGGGLLQALEHARTEDLLVLNGDTYFAVRLEDLLGVHRGAEADCSLALFRSPDQRRYLGVTLGASGEVLALDAAPAGGASLVNGGVYLFRRGALDRLPWRPGDRLSLESELLPHALRSRWRMMGLECGARFIDIGLPEDYARAATVVATRAADSRH